MIEISKKEFYTKKTGKPNGLPVFAFN